MAMMFRGTGKPIDQLDISLLQNSDPFGFGGRPDYSMNIVPTQQAPQAASKPKVGIAEILGGLGDVISAASGGQPSFLPQRQAQLEQQRLLQQRAQMAQDARNADWEDWVRQKQWERDNPAPQALSDFERTLIGSGIQPGTPEWQQAFVTRRDNQLDPWTNIVVGGNSVSGRQSAVQRAVEGGGGLSSPQAGGAAIPPTAPVGKLRPIGGGTPSASSGFR